MARRQTDARIRRVAGRRLESDEEIVGWSRAWYSRAARRPRLQVLAARYRDVVVLTDRRLMLWEVGMLTRIPRRRVLADRLDQLTVEDLTGDRSARRVRFSKPGHRAMILELDRGDPLGAELLARAGRRVDAPVDAPTDVALEHPTSIDSAQEAQP